MENIEIKVRMPDRAAMEARLGTLGADLIWRRRQRDVFFRADRGWLKLRCVDGRDGELIAYERPTDTVAARISDYVLARVDAPSTEAALTRALGVEATVAKERTLWRWRNTRIHLDRVDGLGDFLELETVLGDIDRAGGEAESRAVIAALELDDLEWLARPYRDLLVSAVRDPGGNGAGLRGGGDDRRTS